MGLMQHMSASVRWMRLLKDPSAPWREVYANHKGISRRNSQSEDDPLSLMEMEDIWFALKGTQAQRDARYATVECAWPAMQKAMDETSR